MTFVNNQTGAVTVDWVVLTAALVGLGIATMTVVSQGTQDVSEDISAELESNVIGTSMLRFSHADIYDTTEAAYASMSGNTLMSANSLIGTHGSFPNGSFEHADHQARQLLQMDSYPNAYLTQRQDYPNKLTNMLALDRSTVTAADIAGVTNISEAFIQSDIDTHAGGDAGVYYDTQLALIEMRAAEYEKGMERVTELGLN